MTPIDAIKREVEIELDALARRLGSAVLKSVTIRVEFDERTKTIRSVDCVEERRRHIHGGSIPSQAKRDMSAA